MTACVDGDCVLSAGPERRSLRARAAAPKTGAVESVVALGGSRRTTPPPEAISPNSPAGQRFEQPSPSVLSRARAASKSEFEREAGHLRHRRRRGGGSVGASGFVIVQLAASAQNSALSARTTVLVTCGVHGTARRCIHPPLGMRGRWLGPQHIRRAFRSGRCGRRPRTRLPLSHLRHASSTPTEATVDPTRTRNIGIIAHIDAGKTTTTERMLYYSGFTRRLGDVDDGSTVTDFLPAERARGITIQSAAITFSWPPTGRSAPSSNVVGLRSTTPHIINLVDTPGHADFTFEVIRSLRVLDGAVCILDGVAGVEAQTEQVWSQASAYAIPRIIYVNKLDRAGAAFGSTVKEIAAKLHMWPAVCSIPWWTAEGNLRGVGDVVGLRGLHYVEGGDGKDIFTFDLPHLREEDHAFAAELERARMSLVELLSEHDDAIVEKYLETDENHLAISPIDVINSLRMATLERPQRIAPVFAGASFRNIGVQPLLDAVVNLLPSPQERPDPEISFGGEVRGGLSQLLTGKVGLTATGSSQHGKGIRKDKAPLSLQNLEACALAFKVVSDSKRGILVYIRVYSGSINRNCPLWNTNLQLSERAQRLLRMYANEAVDIESIPAGQIGVIPGLKATRTGDTLVSYTGLNPKTGPPPPLSNLQLRPIDVPPAVFFVSVEPNSLTEEKHIQQSLDLLLREDPSLQVKIDDETGQTHLSGMGELHLEIAKDRLVNDLKAKARIGSIEIGYRETLTAESDTITEIVDREVGGRTSKAACSASVRSRDGMAKENDDTHAVHLPENNRLLVHTPSSLPDGSPSGPEQSGLPDHLPIHAIEQAIRNGVLAALARGPTHAYPMHSIDVDVTFDATTHLFPNTTAAALSSAARLATQHAMRQSAKIRETALMEPVMSVTISVDEVHLGSVVHDISSARGGTVVSLGSGDDLQRDVRQQSIDSSRVYSPPDLFAGSHPGGVAATASHGANARQVIARIPLQEMAGYLRHLRSLTGGRGTFTMTVDRFEIVNGARQRFILDQLRGDLR